MRPLHILLRTGLVAPLLILLLALSNLKAYGNLQENPQDDSTQAFIDEISLYQRGRRAFEFGLYFQAIELWQQSLREEQTSSNVLLSLGQAYQTIGEFTQAGDALKRAIALDPLDWQGHFLLGQIYLEQADSGEQPDSASQPDYKHAVEALRRASELQRADPVIEHTLGIALLKLGDSAEAVIRLEIAAALREQQWDTHFWLARAYAAERQYENAYKHFQRAQTLNPDEWTISFWQGVTHFENGYALEADGKSSKTQYRAGLSFLKKIVAKQEDPSLAKRLDGIERYLKKDYAHAVQILREAVALNSNEWQNYFWLGLAILWNGNEDKKPEDYALAIEPLTTALALAPPSAHAIIYNRLGIALSEAEQNSEALNPLQTAIRLNPLNWENHFRLGKVRYRQGDYQAAIESLTKAVELKTEDYSVFLWLGAAYNMIGNYDESITALTRAIELKPDSQQNYFWLGQAHYRKGDHAQAIELFNRVKHLRSRPGDKVQEQFRLDWLADAQFNAGQVSQAVSSLEQAVQLAPSNARILRKLGQAHLANSDADRALATLNKVLILEPEDWRAHAQLGRIYLERESFDLAQRHFAEALRLNESEPAHKRGLGASLVGRREYSRGHAMLEEAREQLPDDGETLYWLGRARYGLDQFDQALALLTQASELLPNTWEPLLWIGKTHFNLRRYDAAEQAFQAMWQKKPQGTDPYFSSGLLYMTRSEYDQAVTVIKRGIQVKPHYALYELLGFAQRRRGALDEALGAFEQAHKLNPKHPGPLENLARIHRERQQYQQAIARYREVLALASDNSSSHLGLGLSYYALGQMSPAIMHLRQVVEIDPGNANAYYHLGLCYEYTGDYREGVAALEQAAGLQPDFHNWRQLGYLSVLAQQPGKAISALERAIASQPDDPYNHRWMGWALFDLGRYQQALSHFNTARSLGDKYVLGAFWTQLKLGNRRAARQLTGPVSMLGIRFTYLGQDAGVRLTQIIADSPAEKAGLRRGDVVLNIGGVGLGGDEDPNKLLGAAAINQDLKIIAERDGQRFTVSANPYSALN